MPNYPETGQAMRAEMPRALSKDVRAQSINDLSNELVSISEEMKNVLNTIKIDIIPKITGNPPAIIIPKERDESPPIYGIHNLLQEAKMNMLAAKDTLSKYIEELRIIL